jgi:hypothetical protein
MSSALRLSETDIAEPGYSESWHTSWHKSWHMSWHTILTYDIQSWHTSWHTILTYVMTYNLDICHGIQSWHMSWHNLDICHDIQPWHMSWHTILTYVMTNNLDICHDIQSHDFGYLKKIEYSFVLIFRMAVTRRVTPVTWPFCETFLWPAWTVRIILKFV